MRLQTKFSLGLTFLISLTACGVGGFTIWSERQTLEREIKQHHQQLADQLAQVSEESLFQGNLVFFNFTKALKKERGFRSAAFVDLNGTVQMHSDPTLVGKPAKSGILSYTAPVSFKGSSVGEAHLEISPEALQAFLNESLRDNIQRIGLITLGVLFLALIIGFVFARTMVAPIQQVVEGMKKVSAGQRTPLHFPMRHDELGWMGEELNQTIAKLKELDEMKQDFVAGVTHELKSPLEAIDGFVSLLETEADRKGEFLLAIQNNSKRLRSLIDDLLLTARLEAQREEFNAQQFDVCPLVQEVSHTFLGLSKQKGIPVQLRFSTPKIDVWADPDKVVHVLTNLLSNAFKYTPQGSIDVGVTGDTKEVKISVADTGTGIPLADRDKVFEKFYRSRSNAKKAKGTGLGLSIAKGLVEGLGGKIWIDANPRGGSIFSFTLPR